MSHKTTAITTGISIKPELLDAAKQRAQSLDISLSKLVCQVLKKHLTAGQRKIK